MEKDPVDSDRAGLSIVAEIADRLRWNPEEFRIHSSAIDAFADDYQHLKAYLREAVVQWDCTDLVLFNGRFAIDSAVLDLGDELGIPVHRCEAGGQMRGYDFFSHSPHDREALQDRMRDLVSVVHNSRQAAQLGRTWFVNRGAKRATEDRREIVEVGRGLRPGSRLTFFMSSPDEFYLIDSADAKKFMSQEQALAAAARLAASCGTRLLVRTHPNMAGASARERQQWEVTVGATSNIDVIDAKSPVNSYELAATSDLVLTYGSTIGVEAMFMGSPVVTLGPSIYSALLGESVAHSPEQLQELAMGPRQPNEDHILAYGLFSQVRGYPYLNYVSRGHGTGAFLGQPVPKYGRASHVIPNFLHALRTRWLSLKVRA